MQVTTIGLDLAKHLLQVHDIDVTGKVLIRHSVAKTITRWMSGRPTRGILLRRGFRNSKTSRRKAVVALA